MAAETQQDEWMRERMEKIARNQKILADLDLKGLAAGLAMPTPGTPKEHKARHATAASRRARFLEWLAADGGSLCSPCSALLKVKAKKPRRSAVTPPSNRPTRRSKVLNPLVPRWFSPPIPSSQPAGGSASAPGARLWRPQKVHSRALYRQCETGNVLCEARSPVGLLCVSPWLRSGSPLISSLSDPTKPALFAPQRAGAPL